MFSYVCREHPLLAKTVVYRVASVAVTAVVAYLVVGDLATAIDVGVIANVVKMGLYYAHERTWESLAPLAVEE